MAPIYSQFLLQIFHQFCVNGAICRITEPLRFSDFFGQLELTIENLETFGNLDRISKFWQNSQNIELKKVGNLEEKFEIGGELEIIWEFGKK